MEVLEVIFRLPQPLSVVDGSASNIARGYAGNNSVFSLLTQQVQVGGA